MAWRRREQKDSAGTRESRTRSWTVFVVSRIDLIFHHHTLPVSLFFFSVGLANIRRRAIALKEQRARMKMQQGGEGRGGEGATADADAEEVEEGVRIRMRVSLYIG